MTIRRCDLTQNAFLGVREISWEFASDRGMIEQVQIIRQRRYFLALAHFDRSTQELLFFNE